MTPREWIARIYGDVPGALVVSHQSADGSFVGTGGWCADHDQAADRIARLDAEGAQGVYLRTTTVGRRLNTYERGGAVDSHALPGLWADVDLGTTGHAHDPSPDGCGCGRTLPPDEAEARRIVTTSGLPTPSLWVHSGGGLYPWWLLDQPALVTDDNRAALSALSSRWQSVLGKSAERLGYCYGTGVGDLSRVLRVPGTTNRKAGQERPCRVMEDTGQVYAVGELLDALPAPEAPPVPKPAPVRLYDGGGESVLDRYAAEHTWTDVLAPHGFTACPARHGPSIAQCFVRPGNPEHTCSAHVLTANPHVLVVWSESAGLPVGGGQALTKARVAAHLGHGGDLSAFSRSLLGRDSAPAATVIAPAAGTATTLDQRRSALGGLLVDLRTWQHLPDPTHVVAALAASATRHGGGEPCWLLLVAPPSSGKTEAVRVLDDTADARLDEVTAAGLLGWSKGKTVKPTGVLARVGPQALVTLGDLSGLLATSDRGGRDQVFALLRRAYDGHVTRDVSPPGKLPEGTTNTTLAWSGRLTVVACVTGAIDRYTAHADQLGARWVYVRLPDRTTAEKRRASTLARRGNLSELRRSARDGASRLLDGIGADLPDLPDPVAEAVEDAALVTAWGRGAVPRNGYGRRDIEGVPVVEEPMRLVQQLGALARGVLALGLPDQAAAYVARRVALDSMPEARRNVLHALAHGGALSTSAVARAASLDRKVARFQLEELTAIGVVTNDRVDDEDDEPAGTVTWSLAGEDGALIAQVIGDHERAGGWDEMWVYTSTSLPREREEETTTGSEPTLRPTPDAPLASANADESREDAPTDPTPRDLLDLGITAPAPRQTPTVELDDDDPTAVRCRTCREDPGAAGLDRLGRCFRCEIAARDEPAHAER